MAGFVKFIGLSDVRTISRDQWARAGAQGQDEVVWSKRNQWSVPVDQFTNEALDLLKKDKSFALPEQQDSPQSVETSEMETQPTGETTPSGATTTDTSNQPTSTRGSRSGGKGGVSS